MWYDVICALILGLSLWRGMIKGFVWQLATIAGIILCFIFAETVSVAVAPMTGLEPPLSRWVSILGLYIASSFVAYALARTLKTGIEKAKFDDFDRHLGAIFGLIKGATLCLVASFFLFTLSESTRETVIHSQAGYASALLFHQIRPVMPAELHKLIEPYVVGFDPETIADHREKHPTHQSQELEPAPLPGAPGYPTVPGGNSNNPFDQSGTGQTSIEKILRSLPGIYGQDLQQMVVNAIEQTAPADRDELIEQLSTGMPGLIRQVADQWKNGKPVPPAPTNSATVDWKQYRAHLLRQIAGVYTDHLAAQQLIMEEVVYALHGVPDQVTVKVLEDWNADLLGTQPDPDPTTSKMTSIDARIASQLRKANISVATLSTDLRERMALVDRNLR